MLPAFTPAGSALGSSVCLHQCRVVQALFYQGVNVEFLAEYASFLAKTATLVIAILVVLSAIAGMRGKGRRKSGGQLQVTRLNEFYKELRERLEAGLLDKAQLKALRKQQAKAEKQQKKGKAEEKRRVFVLDFDGDHRAADPRHATR